MKFIVRSLEETLQLGESLAKHLKTNDILVFNGGLGAGKTTFIKAIATGLGIDPDLVNSPTFTIMQNYKSTTSGVSICHIDAYRLIDGESFKQEGLTEIFNDNYIVCIEWPEIIETALPNDILEVNIERSEQNIDISNDKQIILSEDNASRTLEFVAKGERGMYILGEWEMSTDFPSELQI